MIPAPKEGSTHVCGVKFGIAVEVTRARSRRIVKSGAWRLDLAIQPEPVRLLP